MNKAPWKLKVGPRLRSRVSKGGRSSAACSVYFREASAARGTRKKQTKQTNMAWLRASEIEIPGIPVGNAKVEAAVEPAGVVRVRGFAASQSDFTLLEKLEQEWEAASEKTWHSGSHTIVKNPECSSTFRSLVGSMGKFFGMDVAAVRANVYRGSDAFKPFHQDRQDRPRQNFTCILSLGATRCLSFRSLGVPRRIEHFASANGDLLGFTDTTNAAWEHGVLSSSAALPTDRRISIVAWGYIADPSSLSH